MTKTNDITLTVRGNTLRVPYDKWVDPAQKDRIIGMIDAMEHMAKGETT